uniref:TPR_REGION domain-containing protein n=1 Tax=Rhabditophanes sp. KR3021 TaxID=114890 RepID=A0AC35TH01_9BILA
MLKNIGTLRNLFGVYARTNSSQPISLLNVNERRQNNWREKTYENGQRSSYFAPFGKTLIAASFMVTLKDFFGIEKVSLDNDPLKDLVKRSWLASKYQQYDKAIAFLNEALKMAMKQTDEMVVTRIYSELASTYYFMENNEKAEQLYKLVLQRLIQLHKESDSTPVFIGVSIKLATVFANKGDIENAEIGLKHCVTKQMKNVDEHLKKYVVAHGAYYEQRNLVDEHGAVYTDPLALFGFALNTYAHFLIKHRGEDRIQEAEECMDESLKLAYTIYGSTSPHTLNLLNNFGAACVMKNYFETALKYLSIGITRIVNVSECSDLIVGFYCNYAEALYHTDKKESALSYSEKAIALSKSMSPDIQKYAENYHNRLAKSIKDGKKREGKGWFF